VKLKSKEEKKTEENKTISNNYGTTIKLVTYA
jgi:hypothetical protein